MNYRGSYRKLLGNAKAAMMAAIEIYNKPAFQYRDECFVILLLNAWELLLKAMLSKNKGSVFYHKKRNEPYRTLSWHDALGRAERHFPSGIHSLPVRRNLELLGTYRDNAVHFYNAKGFGVLVYALAQTSIMNFRDIMEQTFGERLEDEITWQLLPLGIKPPVDPIAYMQSAGNTDGERSDAVRQFLAELAAAVNAVQAASKDTGRLLTVFQIKLESTKKINTADLVIGVEKTKDATGPLAIIRTQDPNITHPLRQKDVLEQIDTLHGKPFTSHVFYAIAWKHDLRSNPQYCWRDRDGALTKYSNDVIAWIRRLKADEVDAALTDYREHLRTKQWAKKAKKT